MELRQQFDRKMANQSREYVAIRRIKSKDKLVIRLPLPIVIGAAPECDIIINSPSVAKCARIVLSVENEIKVFDFKRRAFIPKKYLLQHGIQVFGPFKGLAPNKPGLKSSLREFLAGEERWFAKLPRKLRVLLGAKLKQWQRLAVWGNALAFILIGLYVSLTSQAEIIDRSKDLIQIEKGSLISSGYGSVPSYREFAHGVSFGVDLTGDDLVADYLLSFELKGIDFAKEIKLILNGTQIFAADASKQCLYEYCAKEVLIEKTLLKVGKNVFRFLHQSFESDYVIKNIIFSEVNSVSPSERLLLERRLEADERAFAERGISHQNIIGAKRDLLALRETLVHRKGVEALRVRADALIVEVDKETVHIIEELSFQAERAYQLAKLDEAKDKYKMLLEFYPDPTSKDHKRIKNILEEIEEISH